MSKLKIDPSNPKTFARMVKEGRGLGEGEHYEPWLNIKDLSSKGISTKMRGWRTGSRLIQIFSRLEHAFLFRLEWDLAVKDYREQFPLDMRLTRMIADELGFPHPMGQNTGLPMPMTTDFLVTRLVNGEPELTAYYLKPHAHMEIKDSEHPRRTSNNWKKFQIEREYWLRRGAKHELVTERGFDQMIVYNVKRVHDFYDVSDLAPVDSAGVELIHEELFPQVLRGQDSLRGLSSACDKKFGLASGCSLNVVRHLVARRRWPANFKVKFDVRKPLALKI